MPVKIISTVSKPFNKSWFGDLPGNQVMNQAHLDLFLSLMSQTKGYISHYKNKMPDNIKQYVYVFESADDFYAARNQVINHPAIKSLYDQKLEYETANGFNRSFSEEVVE